MKTTTKAIVALGTAIVKVTADTDKIIAMYTEAGTASAVVAAALADCVADKVIPKECIVGWLTTPSRRPATVTEKEAKVMNALNALRSRAIYHFNKLAQEAEEKRISELSDDAKAELAEANAKAAKEKADKKAKTMPTDAECLAQLYKSAHAAGLGKALKALAQAAKEMGLELPTV